MWSRSPDVAKEWIMEYAEQERVVLLFKKGILIWVYLVLYVQYVKIHSPIHKPPQNNHSKPQRLENSNRSICFLLFVQRTDLSTSQYRYIDRSCQYRQLSTEFIFVAVLCVRWGWALSSRVKSLFQRTHKDMIRGPYIPRLHFYEIQQNPIEVPSFVVEMF